MDVAPLVSKGRQLIESCGDGTLKTSGSVYPAPVIAFSESCFSPETFQADESAFKILREVFQKSYGPSIMLFGAEGNTRLIPEIEKEFVRQQNCALNVMNTGTACRTFNVLCVEDRRVAAVLFPVD